MSIEFSSCVQWNLQRFKIFVSKMFPPHKKLSFPLRISLVTMADLVIFVKESLKRKLNISTTILFSINLHKIQSIIK